MVQVSGNDLKILRPLFNDIRFYMGKSVLDGKQGKAFTDNKKDPGFAYLQNKFYYFISGNITFEQLKKVIYKITKAGRCLIVPSDNIGKMLESLFQEQFFKKKRYSIKKNTRFDLDKLKTYISNLSSKYELKNIDEHLSERIIAENFKNITDNFTENGIGVCCLYNDELIGVCASNIVYNDGIEVNIRTKEGYQRQGIATAMAAKLILECLARGKNVSWDAANLESLKLAEKLGFEYDSAYDVYVFEEKQN